MWFSGLHLVVLFPGYFVFNFLSFLKKDQKPVHNKKRKKAEKRQTKSVSAVVFTNSNPNSGGWATNWQFLLKNL